MVIVPILTMRVIAEERKQKTDQLLYSLPITTTQVVIGKYLALLTVYLIPLCIICIYPLIFSQFGDVYLLTSYGSVFAFFVLGAALIAVGVFISSLTENQGFAAGIGIAVILLNYYSVSLSEYVSSTATGSVIALGVIVLALGAVIRYLTKTITSPMRSVLFCSWQLRRSALSTALNLRVCCRALWKSCRCLSVFTPLSTECLT